MRFCVEGTFGAMITVSSLHDTRILKADFRENLRGMHFLEQSVLSAGMDVPAPWGSEIQLSNILLLPASFIELNTDGPGQRHLFIPVSGTMLFNSKTTHNQPVSCEECISLESHGRNITIQNPYTEHNIQFLHFRFITKGNDRNRHSIRSIAGTRLNHFNTISLTTGSLSIGVFTGRTKGVYPLKPASASAMVYVIHGAFELEDRLLEQNDALLIWNKEKIEFEALSEHAILLVFENKPIN